MDPQGKAAVQSVTQLGIAGTAFFWALPFVLRHLGFHAEDVKGVSDAVKQLVELGLQAAVPVGLIVAAWGRSRASQPVTGVFKPAAAPQTQPPAEDPPY